MPVYRYRTRKGLRYFFKVSVEGVQYLKRGFESRRLASKAETAFVADFASFHKRIRFSSLLDSFLGYYSKKVKDSTFYSYRLRAAKYYSRIPDKWVDQLRYSDFYKWMDTVKPSKFLLEKFIGDLSNIFEYCKIYFGIENLEYRKIMLPKDWSIPKAPSEKFILSVNQFRKLYSVIDDSFYRLLFLFEFVCGLRISELAGIQIDCIDMGRKSVFIRQQMCQHLGTGDSELTFPKSRKSVRVIYLPDFLFLKVSSLIEDNSLEGKDFLFFGRSHSEAIGINTVYRFLKEYQRKSGLPEFRFHSFRKSEASLLNDSGLSGDVIRDYLGHDSFETTKEYYLGDSDEKKEKIRALLQSKLSDYFK